MAHFEIIAFPRGGRVVAASLPSPEGQCAEGIVAHAVDHARIRGEFVTVERDGSEIAVVGGAGPICGECEGCLSAQDINAVCDR